MLQLFYYLIYYLGLPAILLYFLIKRKSYNEFLGFFRNLKTSRTEQGREVTRDYQRRQRHLRWGCLIILILYLGSWHLVTSELVDMRMKSEIKYGASGIYSENPVIISLGPTYDVDKVVKTIRNKEQRWLPDQVKKVVNLDNLGRFKGRIAVYRTYDQRYIITYTYLAPYPIVKTYGFQYVEADGDLSIIKKDRRTIWYPLNPGTADNTARLLG